MSTQAVDTTDAIGVESLVFQGDQSERSSWKSAIPQPYRVLR